MAGVHPLIEAQRLDSYADALRARRAALPERAASAEKDAAIRALLATRAQLDGERTALAREERRIEALVADLDAKAHDVETRLYSGQVKAVKELEALQHELNEGRRKQAEQETAELDLLEKAEALDARLGALDAEHATLAAALAELRARLAALEADLDGEIAGATAKRDAALAALEPTLVKRYQTLREAKPIRGQAVVRVESGACAGCRASLPIAFASELSGKPAGTTVACPRCGRILVL
jgi:predicted  nucleic acid-binding Zn-ribbon protein